LAGLIPDNWHDKIEKFSKDNETKENPDTGYPMQYTLYFGDFSEKNYTPYM
jgi:hypothetical protein